MPFVLVFIVSTINTFTICYAVVNLRFASVNRLIRWVCTHLSLSGGGLKWTFWHLVASQPSGLAILSLLLTEFGGLKWTRTIDLTLIRRVL